MCQRPDADDLPHIEWVCSECGAANSMWDAECQYCDNALTKEMAEDAGLDPNLEV